jgi:hypothetical protein
MEVLLSTPRTRSEQIRTILEEASQSSSRSSPETWTLLQTEIGVISECLRGDDTSVSIPQSASAIEVMCRADWMEEPFRPTEDSPEAQILNVKLPRGTFFKRVRFLAAGLSTLCSHAYFLNWENILIYSLRNQGETLAEQPIFRRSDSHSQYYAAALSERFLAVLIEVSREKSISVFRYDGQMVGMDKFGMEPVGHQWNPNSLIAIHETDNRSWIAVGGCIKQDGVFSGSIKMYCIDESGGTATMTKRPVSLNRPKPNPLALDLLKTLRFSPDGERLVCTTNNNRVLVWRLSHNARPDGAPFTLERVLKTVSLP